MTAKAPATVLVTAGPSYEPIDEVRRITNSSSGELGVMLANRLAKDGWPVALLLGTGAVFRGPLEPGVRRVAFGTNDDLLRRFRELSTGQTVAAIFQAAALCDFKVRTGQFTSAKISSRAGEITLVLEPAVKVIGQLRNLFPQSRIVGWKYEVAGTRDGVLEKARRQLSENRTDLCVANGRAYGDGFGIVSREAGVPHLAGKAELCAWLSAWLAETAL